MKRDGEGGGGGVKCSEEFKNGAMQNKNLLSISLFFPTVSYHPVELRA